MYMYATMSVWKSEGSLLELVQSFYHDLGTELKLSNLVAGAFPQWAILSAPLSWFVFWEASIQVVLHMF